MASSQREEKGDCETAERGKGRDDDSISARPEIVNGEKETKGEVLGPIGGTFSKSKRTNFTYDARDGEQISLPKIGCKHGRKWDSGLRRHNEGITQPFK